MAYEDNWGEGRVPVSTFSWDFSNKWLVPDGRGGVTAVTGRWENNSWNVIRGEFVLRQ